MVLFWVRLERLLGFFMFGVTVNDVPLIKVTVVSTVETFGCDVYIVTYGF